jgi:hypothetical protein
METKVKTEKSVATSTEDSTVTTDSVAENLPMLPPASETNGQLQQISGNISKFLAQLPVYFSRFFEAYKVPLISLGLIFGTIVALRVVFAVVDALNGIPLFSSFFEAIGIGYGTWFVYRYLLQASTRQELATKIQSLKQEFVGDNSSELS